MHLFCLLCINSSVYKLTSPEGLAYIGQAISLKSRMTIHKKPNTCRAISSAIQQHGFDQFKFEILASGLNWDEADFLEERYIDEHGTLTPGGFNLTTGGAHPVPSDETKKRIIETKKSRKPFKKLKCKNQLCEAILPEKTIVPVPNYMSIKLLVEKYPEYTKVGLRHLLRNQYSNGLFQSHAIIRIGRKIVIDEALFFAWVKSQNGDA